jgi:hypothetical protein
MIRTLLSLFLWMVCTTTVMAQALPFPLEVPLPGVTGFDPRIPKPEDIIGHQIGTRHTAPHQIVEYVRAVDAASDRVRAEVYAHSYEGRPLLCAWVTAPAHHDRLEAIRQANVRLSEDPATVSDAAVADQPVVIWQGYSIHGNEASGSEAALLYLYYLAAGQGPGIEAALQHVVVLLDPMFNPDGRDRFVDWVNRNRGAVPTTDAQDREHNEPWPGGRTNHYWFDLNRDWLPAQHPESQGRLRLFHQWRPQLLTDHHEMGGNETFFFQPGIPASNNPLTPQRTFDLTAEVATWHARRLDALGALYFTRETFDDFYYGKGSTYPDVNGAVGILFEQASARALQAAVGDGTLSYAFTVRNQFVASLSTLEAAVALRTKLLRHQRDFYAEVPALARQHPVKGWLISLARGRNRAQLLAQILLHHRIRVFDLTREVTVEGQTFRPGEAWLIPAQQPQFRLLRSVMERQTSFADSLFYDVSAWTLPLAFDLDHAALRIDVAPLQGQSLTEVTLDGGALVGGRSDYAYLMTWDAWLAPRALYQLQAAGLKPRLMTDDFTALVAGQPRAFARGTVVIPVANRDGSRNEAVHDLVARLVQETHVHLYAVESGLTPDGPELGSPRAVLLEQPRMALLTGPGTNANAAGEVWHLLSERFRLPVSLLETGSVASADLDRYSVLVMAGGGYGNVPVERLKAWVQGGGHLLTLGSATDWAVAQKLLDLTAKPFAMDSLLQGLPYDQIGRTRDAQQIAGTIFEVQLDTSHPLAYGMPPTLAVFRDSDTFYAPDAQPGTTIARYGTTPRLAGYVSDERLRQAGGSAALVARRLGRGRLVAFMDNPTFRAFWLGTSELFLNAVFLSGAF